MTSTLTIRPARLCAAFALATAVTAGAMLATEYNDIRTTSEHLAIAMFKHTGRTPDTGEHCALQAHADLTAKFAMVDRYVLPVQGFIAALPGMPGGYLSRLNSEMGQRRAMLDRERILAGYDIAQACGLYHIPHRGLTV